MKLLIDNRLIEFVSSPFSFPRFNSIHSIVFVETVDYWFVCQFWIMVSSLGCPYQFSPLSNLLIWKKLFAAFPFICSPGSRPHQRCHNGVATTSCGKGIWKKWKVRTEARVTQVTRVIDETATSTYILLSCNQSLLWIAENIVGAIWKLHFMSVSLSKINERTVPMWWSLFRPLLIEGRILPTFNWFLFWLRLIALLLAFSFHDNVFLFVACSRLSVGGKWVFLKKIVGSERKPFLPLPTNFSPAPWNKLVSFVYSVFIF